MPFDPNRAYSSSHTLPDGTEVHVRYEHSQVAGCSVITRCADGKTVTLNFDGGGVSTNEQHSFGNVANLYLVRYLDRGKLEQELYFYKHRPLTRKKYDALRSDHPGMPAPTVGVVDPVAELESLLAADTRARRSQAKRHVADPERGKKLDTFCQNLLASGNPKNVAEWILHAGSTFGERNRRASRMLAAKLFNQGALHIWACNVDEIDPGHHNTGHLVVELPTDAQKRRAVLVKLDRLAREQGYEGDPDDGQRFAYVKLD